jgi:hypothetical protein
MTIAHGAVARIACFTEHACLVGDIAVDGQGVPRRVLDLLNETRTSAISLIEPTIVRPERLDLPLGTFASGRLRKADLLCVAVLDEPERPAGRRLASYVAKSPVHVALVLRSLALIGTVHVTARIDPIDHILAWPEPFLSLTEAGLVLGGEPIPEGAPPEPMTIFVNRTHVVGVLSSEHATPHIQPSAGRYAPSLLAVPR